MFVVTGGSTPPPCPSTTPAPYGGGGGGGPYGGGKGYGYGKKGFPPFWPPFWWWKWPGGFPYGQYGQDGTGSEQPVGGYKPGPWVRGKRFLYAVN